MINNTGAEEKLTKKIALSPESGQPHSGNSLCAEIYSREKDFALIFLIHKRSLV
jgi:hypothetical protein